MKFLRSTVLAATVASSGVPALALGVVQGPPPAPVRVDAIRRESVQQRRRVTGEVRPRRRSFVAAREPGLVLELPARPGDAIEAGGVLARLDRAPLELALATLMAQRQAAEVTLEQRREEAAQADRDLEVTRDLVAKKTVGQKALVDVGSFARVAHLRVAQAQSELAVLGARQAELERRLDDATLLAPFAGVIVAKHAEVGEWLEVGKALVELVSADELEVWLDVPQDYAGALAALDDPIALRIDAVELAVELAGGRRVPQVDANARTFKFVIDVPRERLSRASRAGGALLPLVAPGMSVSAEVPTGARAEHWTVARDAILRSDAGSFLYVARAGPGGVPQAERIPVDVLFTAGQRVVVLGEGLSEGDRAVVEGNERLFPGAPLMPVDDPAPEPDAGAGQGEHGA